MSRAFQKLVAEAESRPFSGWDFSYLKGRYTQWAPSWNYKERVKAKMKGAKAILDMGTGGGELLSSLQPLPEDTCATESWPPNVEVARKRLGPLGAKVVWVDSEDRLPFSPDHFDLVINRHEDFVAEEVFRVVRPGGIFVTQQVGGRNTDELNQLLQKKVHGVVTHPNPTWCLAKASAELKDAGFRITEGLEETGPSYFYDVGAVVYFLKHIPWEIPDFDTTRYRQPLLELHQRITKEGRLEVTTSRFYLEARKPSA